MEWCEGCGVLGEGCELCSAMFTIFQLAVSSESTNTHCISSILFYLSGGAAAVIRFVLLSCSLFFFNEYHCAPLWTQLFFSFSS